MEEVQNEIKILFEYKEKYCEEDTINYKYYQNRDSRNNDEDDNNENDFIYDNNIKSNYCFQWNSKEDCYIENTLIFSDFQSYSLTEINNRLGCISCCKDCSNSIYINDLLTLKSKSISNHSQKYSDYKIITFRNRKNSTDYPIIYHTKNQSINYCSILQHTSPCSNTYTCFPVSPQSIVSNEMDNDVPDFANIIFILLFIVIVVSVIALIWVVIYVIRTYRRHKKANQISDENDGEDSEEIYDSQDEKEYLSDNYDYVYNPSEVEKSKKIVKLKIDS
ncbi:hypothetical protein PIROE2DRAFT_18695 [Piromyces sp. E2]|nr:hypothetical protein PIROE2DRAFT_18695 [Piromyces sp. E2]|eukprot:OUM56610.1 hypothetical protein PIROE2DRAFT_18695 [Piromyces sp. E2]